MPPRQSSPCQASLAGRREMSLTAPCHPHAALPAATADLPSGPASRPGRQVPQARELDDLCQGAPAALRQGVHDHCVTNDIDTLATALYVRTDDLLKQYPDLAPWQPKTACSRG
jgi:hypothetical protein